MQAHTSQMSCYVTGPTQHLHLQGVVHCPLRPTNVHSYRGYRANDVRVNCTSVKFVDSEITKNVNCGKRWCVKLLVKHLHITVPRVIDIGCPVKGSTNRSEWTLMWIFATSRHLQLYQKNFSTGLSSLRGCLKRIGSATFLGRKLNSSIF